MGNTKTASFVAFPQRNENAFATRHHKTLAALEREFTDTATGVEIKPSLHRLYADSHEEGKKIVVSPETRKQLAEDVFKEDGIMIFPPHALADEEDTAIKENEHTEIKAEEDV